MQLSKSRSYKKRSMMLGLRQLSKLLLSC